MLSKCLLLLVFSTFIEAQYISIANSCTVPRLEHGRVRARQRSKLVKFICLPRYELVGNRYATCRNGQWDVPTPVCVKPGCSQFTVENGVQIKGHHGAWVLTLCLPGYSLVGSTAVYCNGMYWNDTIPSCVDAPRTPSLSCDFEDPDICGWIQDELHDFDWKRINTKTPSSFLETGPTYDHTLGIGQKGYYMYIESTSRIENSTARLLSPIYKRDLSLNGCFSFFYHMYGRGTGGLRVYQKPDSVQMADLLKLSDSDKDQYLLWEQWGNQGNFWFSAAPQLKDFNDNFQIVLEGVRGRSFTSDIAIDDVALLQGENCTNFRQAATSPAPPESEQSCQNRCEVVTPQTPSDTGCECHPGCFRDDRCCPDYVELCIFRANSTDDGDNSTPPEQPQTQKLVGETTSTTTTTTTAQPTTSTTTSTTPKPTTQSTTQRTYPPTPTTVTTVMTTLTTKLSTKTTRTQKTKPTTKLTKPTTVKTTFTTRQLTTITPAVQKTTREITSKTTPTTFKTTTLEVVTTVDSKELEKEEAKKSEKDYLQEIGEKPMPSKKSSSVKTAVVTIVVLTIFAGLIYLVLISRTARGREAIARLRGHMGSDTSEVRYLNSNDDDL